MEILPSFKEWSAAMADMFTEIGSLPKNIALKDVDFRFVTHTGNKLFCLVTINGKDEASISFDGRFSPLEELRMWFERVLVPISNGERCPEIVDIHSGSERARLLMIHGGFEDVPGIDGCMHGVPASLFAIHYLGEKEVRTWCFCQTQQLITRFYSAIVNALNDHEELFNNPSLWFSHADFQTRKKLSQVERIRYNFQSNTVKKYLLCEKLYLDSTEND